MEIEKQTCSAGGLLDKKAGKETCKMRFVEPLGECKSTCDPDLQLHFSPLSCRYAEMETTACTLEGIFKLVASK